MRQAPDVERMMVRSGLHLTKFWFSVSQSEQLTRFIIRQINPVRQWKLSPMDLESLDKWTTTPKPRRRCSTTPTPSRAVDSSQGNDKKRARLEAMKHVLRKFEYDGKDEEAIGEPDEALIGPPSVLSERDPGLSFPPL